MKGFSRANLFYMRRLLRHGLTRTQSSNDPLDDCPGGTFIAI